MAIGDWSISSSIITWRTMDPNNPKIAEAYKQLQKQMGRQTIDPSQLHPIEDTLELHVYDPVSATYKPQNPSATGKPASGNTPVENTSPEASAVENTPAVAHTAAAAASEESVDVSWDITVDSENKQIQTGIIKSGSMKLQGIGYRINDDWSLTPFISCLPADDPNSALPYFEKQ